MSKKEILANKYLRLKKEFDGEEFKNIRSNTVEYLVKEFKVVDLEDKIYAINRAIEEKNLRLKKEAFFQTLEGIAYKEKYTNELNELISERRNRIINLQNNVNEILRKNISENWICRIGFSFEINVEIGLNNTDKEHQYFFEWGYSFNTYFKDTLESFRVNYGTTGTFNPFDSKDRHCEYLNGLSIIVNSKEIQEEIIKLCSEAYKIDEELSDKIYKIKDKLNNPF